MPTSKKQPVPSPTPVENQQIESNSYDVETNSINSNSYFFQSTYNNSSNLSMEGLQEYIKYPMIYNAILREISKQAYNSNGQYARAIDTRVSLPLLSYISVLRRTSSDKDVKNKDKKKKQKINLMMKLLNHDKTTRDILRKLDIEGIYVGLLRDTTANNKNVTPYSGVIESIDRLEGLSLNDNFMIQPLDLDYCKIVGFQNNVAIAAFDLMYFNQFKYGGLLNEIKNFPKEFIKAWNDYQKDGSKRWYILDYKTTIALTARSEIEEAYGRPYGLAALADMKSQSDYSNNQYKLVSELASSIYCLILPEGEKEGRCSLNSVQQKEVTSAFENAVKLNTSGNQAKISTLVLPPKTQVDKLTKDASLLKDTLNDENIKKISTSLGFASSALNAASEGSSGFAGLQVNLDIISAQVFQMVNEIAREYTRVLNEHENTKPIDYVDIKYLPISYLNKNDMYEKLKDLYMVAGGSRTYMIAASGVDPTDYLSICDEEISDDLDTKYPPHVTAYNLSDSADKPNPDNNMGANKGGRPQKDDKDLSFSGTKTKATGANKIIKPSTK